MDGNLEAFLKRAREVASAGNDSELGSRIEPVLGMREKQAFNLAVTLGNALSCGFAYSEQMESGGWLVRILDNDGNDLAVIFDGEAFE